MPIFNENPEDLEKGILIMDSEGKYLEVNDYVCNMTGYTREELLKIRVGELLLPRYRKSVREALLALPLTKGHRAVSQFTRKDGSRGIVKFIAGILSRDRIVIFINDFSGKKGAV